MLLIWLLLQIATLTIAVDDRLVYTENGAILGKYSFSTRSKKFLSFTGIPYAEPPVGQLRFQPPVPVGNWVGIYDATKSHPACIQRNKYTRYSAIIGSEDCLYLNVYTPSKNASFPVMLWIHGGGWLTLSGKPDEESPEILLNHDVVLVVPNYRLAVFGMFSTGDIIVPGNNALKDQAMVLKWINKNIKQFGGNPNSVTVFGNSAGAVSAHYFSFSPLTKGLYHRAISQSGTALCPWALSINGTVERNSRKLAKLFNCTTSDTQQMVNCLRNISARKIVATDEDFFEWDKDPFIVFKPVIEVKHKGAFLSEHPVDLFVSGNFYKVPWIVGVTTEEGCLKTSPIYGVRHLLEEFNEELNEKIRISLMYSDHSLDPKNISNEIRKFYFGDQIVGENLLKNATDMYTDGLFLSCTNDAIYFHKKYSKEKVFLYEFAYRAATSTGEIFGYTGQLDLGVCHGDELNYLFPVCENKFDRTANSTETAMRDVLGTLWTNFAKWSVPTPTKDLCDWQPVQSSDYSEYLYIGSPYDLKMKIGLHHERSDFWKRLALNEKINAVV